MGTKAIRKDRELVAVKETVDAQNPVILASGNEAVATIADTLMKLSPSQRSFLRLRFYYESDGACAAKIGVAPKTVVTWKSDPTFMGAYRDLLTQPLMHARAELALLSQKAINRLGELLDSANPAVAKGAIDTILKGRDAQLLTNNVKVEGGDGGDLYMALLSRLAERKLQQVAKPTEPVPDPQDVVEAEFTEIPAS